MYSPNAAPPNVTAITAENARPHITQINDSVAASFGVGACASRCRNRSIASMATITARVRATRPRHVDIDELGTIGSSKRFK